MVSDPDMKNASVQNCGNKSNKFTFLLGFFWNQDIFIRRLMNLYPVANWRDKGKICHIFEFKSKKKKAKIFGKFSNTSPPPKMGNFSKFLDSWEKKVQQFQSLSDFLLPHQNGMYKYYGSGIAYAKVHGPCLNMRALENKNSFIPLHNYNQYDFFFQFYIFMFEFQ